MGSRESHLEVAVDQKIGLKIVIILSKGVDKLLCYLSGEKGGKQRPENSCPPPSRSPGSGPQPP